MKHPAVPYVLPMVAFFALLSIGPQLGLGAWEYPLRVALLATLLWVFARPVLDLRAPHWVGSVLLGLAVFVLWIAPDVLWPAYRGHWLFQNSVTGQVASSVPEDLRASPMVLLFRFLRAVAIVPIVEELFWRGWLMRWLIKNDFLAVPLGTYAKDAFWITAALFGVEHGPFWDVGLATGALWNWWIIRTRSLGDCILSHAVANAALSVYTVAGGHWQYW